MDAADRGGGRREAGDVAASGIARCPARSAASKGLARRSKLAVVTGASTAEASDALAGVGIAGYFPVVVAAEDYAHGKPSPEPYVQAIARLGVQRARDRSRSRTRRRASCRRAPPARG